MSIDVFNRLVSWRKNSTKEKLGVYIAPDAGWVFGKTTSGDVFEKKIVFKNKDWQQVFAEISANFGAVNFEIVLSASWYQLLIIDKPNIAENEIPLTLVWSIKDMVTIPVTDLQLDYYDSPIINRNKITVVVANKTELTPLVEAVYHHRGVICGMTIEQLAICNLHANSSQVHLVISHYADQNVLFTIVKNGQQYMQRRVRGFNDIHTMTADDFAGDVLNNLILEVRRSMDFFESQMRQPPVHNIDILMDGASHALAKVLADNFVQPIKVLNNGSVGEQMATLVYQNFKESK